MSIEELFPKFDAVTSKMERLGRLFVWIMGFTISGVLWGARLEWRQGDHEQRLAHIEALNNQMAEILRQLGQDNAVTKSRLGLSSNTDRQRAPATGILGGVNAAARNE